jgi:hypothetical protein
MPIENRNVGAGTKPVAKYKSKDYVCLVEATPEGEGVVFALQGGKTHKSPSSAGMEVMGGKAVNGWRFWTVDGDAAAPTATPAPKSKGKGRKAKTLKLFKSIPGKYLAEGQHRFWCQACQKPFVAGTAEPEVCPEGHRADDPELSGAPASEVIAADKAEVEA